MSYTSKVWNEAKHKRDRFGRFAKKFKVSETVHLLTDDDIAYGREPSRTGKVAKDNANGTFGVKVSVSPDKSEVGSTIDVPIGNLRHAPQGKASLRDTAERAESDPAMKSVVDAGVPDLAEHLANQYGMDETQKGKYVQRATESDTKLHADIENNLQGHLDSISDGLAAPGNAEDRTKTKNEVYRFEKFKKLAPEAFADLNVEVDPSLKKAELDLETNTIRTPPDANGLSQMAARYLNQTSDLDGYDKASNIPEFAKIIRQLRRDKVTAVDAQGRTKEDLWEQMSMEMMNSSLDLAYKFLWDSVIQNWFFSYFTWLLHSQSRVKRSRRPR